MPSSSIDWQSELATALAQVAGVELPLAARSLLPPSTPICDWCSNLAFSQAKARKTSPAKLASEWASARASASAPTPGSAAPAASPASPWPAFISRVEAVGPYLNFHFSPAFWSALLASAASDPTWGRAESQAHKVLIEFPSVNPNKPWHVGHLRNAILGDSLARLLAASGRTVERMDYIDDLGLQVAQSVWGQSHLPAPKPPEGSHLGSKFDHVLGWQYVEVAQQIAKPEIEKEVREQLKQLEEGHEPMASQARAVVERCVQAQYQTAFAYGIYHDVLIFESDIVRAVFKEGLSKILDSGAAIKETSGKNAGCIVVKLQGEPGFEGMENADKVLIRSDGTATYTGKDVAFQMWKFGLLQDAFVYSPLLVQPNQQTAYMSSKPNDPARPAHPMPFARAQSVVNVIGAEQAYPQKVIAAVMRKMGHGAQADACVHLAYEHVVLPEGRFSGRKGTWMSASGGPGFTADELLEEMRTGALEQIKAEYADSQKAAIAQAVAVAAVRFWFLRPNANQKITFDYEKALSFSGDSGPYIQYAYARACRILEKGREAGLTPAAPGPAYALNEKEIGLARLCLRWPQVVEASALKYQVHPIADFTLEVAGKFNEFYTTTPVLAEGVSDADKSVRLAEVAAARALIGRGMDILGLPRLEKM